MKCPHCGREIKFLMPAEIRLDNKGFSVREEKKLPIEGKYSFAWYQKRDPEVERQVLLIVSPHEH